MQTLIRSLLCWTLLTGLAVAQASPEHPLLSEVGSYMQQGQYFKIEPYLRQLPSQPEFLALAPAQQSTLLIASSRLAQGVGLQLLALQSAQAALQGAQTHILPALELEAQAQVGQVQLKLGENAQALGHFHAATQLYQQLSQGGESLHILPQTPAFWLAASQSFVALGQTEPALHAVQQALQLSSQATHWRTQGLALQGKILAMQGQLDAAAEALTAALSQEQIAAEVLRYEPHIRNWIQVEQAQVALRQGRYDQAQQAAQLALQTTHANDPDLLAAVFGVQAQVHFLSGHVKSAQAYADMALNQALAGKVPAKILESLMHLSQVYSRWQAPDKALSKLQQALPWLPQASLSQRQQVLLQRAELHSWLGQKTEALADYEQVLAHVDQEPDLFVRAQQALRLAQGLHTLQAPGRAQDWYQKAQAWAETLQAPLLISQALAGQAELKRSQGQHSAAQALYQAALAQTQNLRYHPERGEIYSGLGLSQLAQGQSAQAVENLAQALQAMQAFLEGERDAARNLFERLYPTALALAQALLLEGRAEDSLTLLETYRSQRLLQEIQLGDKLSSQETVDFKQSSVWLRTHWDDLSPDTTVLLFGSPASGELLHYRLQALTSDQQTTSQQEEYIGQRFFLDGIFKTSLQAQLQKSDVIKGLQLSAPLRQLLRLPAGETPSLQALTQTYRQLLSNPKSSDPLRQELSQALYQLLIAPHAKALAASRTLLIVPDGSLGLIPFETLQDSQGQYLIEKFEIQYVPSLPVMSELQQRQHPPGRLPMLAFGNPAYEPLDYELEPISSAQELLNLKQQLWTYPKRHMREVYGALYGAQWQALPAAQKEVESLKEIWPQSLILIGADVQEAELKQMSAAGQLRQYQVLHFATHGLTVPEIPDLSALVLSQQNPKSEEDGYLRLPEIAELQLAADFVNLSACETGLGKVFQGEGVYGLSQAFLVAGANQVAVSLWQIHDSSSASLMQALYQQAHQAVEQGRYPAALAAVKRDFLAGKFGETYTHPYYWSPFVIYGRL